jgi:hypothetical protein
MRRVRVGSEGSRRFLAGFAAVLPLLVLASACSREGERRVVAPALPDPPQVTGARWVWEPSALAGAVLSAGKSPLVQRALREAPVGGLRPRHDLAIRAVGTIADGGTVGVTILPYAVDGDPTHAAFVSVADGFGLEAAEFAEMIVGRDPRPDEVGYHSIGWGGQVAWIRSGDPYFPEAGASGSAVWGSAHPSPLKRNWTRLFDCAVERMPTGCSAGAEIASGLVPGDPRAAAIGCGVGAAVGAISCVVDFLRSK